MSLVSSLLGACIGGLLAPPEPTEPAVAEPATVAPAEPSEPVAPTADPPADPPPAAPTIPSPTSIRPELLRPVVLGPAPPRPAPVIVAAPPRARRSPEKSRIPRGWAVDMSAGTSLPIAAGAAVQVETPPRMLVQAELGGLPSGYVDLQNTLSRRSDTTADILRTAMRQAFVVRAAVGVRPLRRRGLEVRGGYTGALYGHSPATVATIPADPELGVTEYAAQLDSTVHCIHAEAGWRWLLRNHFLVRAAVGYVQSLGARLTATTEAQVSDEEAQDIERAAGTIAEVAATTAVRTPMLTLHVGYRF